MKKNFTQATLLFTVILMDLLSGMEFDIFVPSFPQLQHQFSLTPFWVEALLSINFIGFCLSLFFVGNFSDRYGRKPVILVGLIIFIIGSIFCLWLKSYPFFLAGRFLQGVGIAAPAILSFVIVADFYTLKEQQFLISMLNGVMNIAVGFAPVIGSYLTLLFNWQGNFTALLLMALLLLLMTITFIPSHQQHDKELLQPSSSQSIFHSKLLLLLLIFLPVIFVPYWIFVGMSPLLYIKDLGVSLAHFGYYQGILALVFAFGSIIYGLIHREYDFDQKKTLQMSMYLFLVSFVCISLVTTLNSQNPLIITLTLVVFVIAQIIPSNFLYPICLNLMPQKKGQISAVIQGMRLILTSIGLQIAGYFYAGSFRNIGIIIICYITVGMILLFFVSKEPAISK